MEKIWQILGVFFLVSILPGLYWITMSAGEKALQDLEVEQGFCDQIECSSHTREQLIAAIIQNTDYQRERQIRWCLGVDSWADARARRGGWLIGPMMRLGYSFCPDH